MEPVIDSKKVELDSERPLSEDGVLKSRFDANVDELFQAAENNNFQTVKLFIEERDVPANVTNNLRQTLAHVAARNRNLPMIKYVLEKDSSILTKLDDFNYSILQLALEEGALNIVKYLVEKHDADIHELNDHDCTGTAIHTAVQYGHLDIVKYLVEERRVDINVPYEQQDAPPLFFAEKYQRHDILEYLIEERKADLTILNWLKENILYIAVQKDDLSFMKYILDKKKVDLDIDWENHRGETLVHTASIQNRLKILEYLVEEKEAAIDVPKKWNKMTALHCAATLNHYDICKYLVEHGANTELKDEFGRTPARKATDKRLIEYLTKSSSANRSRRSVFLPDSNAFQPVADWFEGSTPLRINYSRCGSSRRK